MAKSKQPAWVGKLRRQLKRAGEKDPDFLAWYERWTREVIAGYDDEEMYFGLYLDGNPRELMDNRRWADWKQQHGFDITV